MIYSKYLGPHLALISQDNLDLEELW